MLPNEFILKAKQNTYASSGLGGDILLSDGGKEFSYEEGGFKYKDKYYGYNPFIGEEIVWQDNKIIWGMNYYGEVVSDIVPVKEVYAFLKTVLRKVEVDRPFRGPREYKNADWKYIDNSTGDVNNFSGEEVIYYKDIKIYKLKYNGGVIVGKL